MRICIDLDGVVCKLKEPGQTYADLEPVDGALEWLERCKNEGHYIILFTARHMKTTSGNIGRVVALQGKVTLDWLDKYSVPYDEIFFGKPWADIYIDDNALRFDNWKEMPFKASDLPLSKEKQKKEES